MESTLKILPSPAVFADVAGSKDAFPIHRIFCVGRNYEAHAREMGKNSGREPPFFFTKYADAYVPTGKSISYPPGTVNYHHEIELVVAIGKRGFAIEEDDAFDYVYGYATGLDMTRRDLQLDARSKGRPWDTGKNFEQSAPIAPIVPTTKTGKILDGEIWLKVNGEVRQTANLRDLIWNVDEIIAHLSRLYVLRPGDLIMSGTPSGVAAVGPGDQLLGHIDGLPELEIEIVRGLA